MGAWVGSGGDNSKTLRQIKEQISNQIELPPWLCDLHEVSEPLCTPRRLVEAKCRTSPEGCFYELLF